MPQNTNTESLHYINHNDSFSQISDLQFRLQTNSSLTHGRHFVRCLRCQDDVVLKVQFGLRIVLFWLEIQDQIVLDSENSVGLKVWVVFGKELGCDWLVIVVCDHKMNMGRTHRMSIQQLQQHTSRSIRRQRVRSRLQAIEIIISILVTLKLSTQIIWCLVLWILEIVFAIRRCLPDVYHRTRYSFSSYRISDFAVHQRWMATWSWVDDDATTKLPERGIW